MPSCYRCGRQLGRTEPRRRRWVVTGGFERKLYPKRGLQETQSRFGMRILCTKCCLIVDRSEGRISRIEDLKLYAALCALAVIAVLLLLGVIPF